MFRIADGKETTLSRHQRKPRKACAKFQKESRVWAVGSTAGGSPGLERRAGGWGGTQEVRL